MVDPNPLTLGACTMYLTVGIDHEGGHGAEQRGNDEGATCVRHVGARVLGQAHTPAGHYDAGDGSQILEEDHVDTGIPAAPNKLQETHVLLRRTPSIQYNVFKSGLIIFSIHPGFMGVLLYFINMNRNLAQDSYLKVP